MPYVTVGKENFSNIEIIIRTGAADSPWFSVTAGP